MYYMTGKNFAKNNFFKMLSKKFKHLQNVNGDCSNIYITYRDVDKHFYVYGKIDEAKLEIYKWLKSIDKMQESLNKAQLIVGETGSGKTFTTVNEAKKVGRFAYFSPTKALTMDTLMAYGQKGDSFKFGFVDHQGDGMGNHFGLMTDLSFLSKINDYDTIIIDECHWAFEFQNHGFFTREVLQNFKGEIKLVTGTQNFDFPVEKTTILKSQREINRNFISLDFALARADIGVPTLIICQSKADIESAKDKIEELVIGYTLCGVQASSKSIRKATKAFNAGEVTCIIGSNNLAQGVNLVCENLIIWDNSRQCRDSYCDCCIEDSCSSFTNHDATLNTQRLGRLGRIGKTKDFSNLTWTFVDVLEENVNFEIEKTNSFYDLPLHEEYNGEFIERDDYEESKIVKLEILNHFNNRKVA